LTVDEIVVVEADGIVTVTLDRPEMKNAISVATFETLRDLFRSITAQQQARCVVLTGTRDFAAGADLSRAGDGTRRERPNTLYSMRVIHDAVVALNEIPVPVIAKVRGVAVGAGMSLALACDMVLASTNARFAAIFARRGLSLDCGASWLLPRLIGPSAAAEIGFTGRMVDAEEAEQLGLLNRLTGPEDLLDQTLAMANQICANSPGGIRLSKRALQANMEVASFAAALELENRGQALLTRCDDMTEALDAFKAKRVPNFSGR